MGKRSREFVVDLPHVADDTFVHVVDGSHERLVPPKPDQEDAKARLPVDAKANQDGADEESDDIEHQSNVGSPTTSFTRAM